MSEREYASVELDLPEIYIQASVAYHIRTETIGGGGHLNHEFDEHDWDEVIIETAFDDDGEVEITPELLEKYEQKILDQWQKY
jgi:hypothetical protein